MMSIRRELAGIAADVDLTMEYSIENRMLTSPDPLWLVTERPEEMTSDASAVAASWLARYERFDVVGSTNDVVAGWLREGTPEVCVALAANSKGCRSESRS